MNRSLQRFIDELRTFKEKQIRIRMIPQITEFFEEGMLPASDNHLVIMSLFLGLWKFSGAHQEAVAFAGGAAAFVNCPND